MPDNQTMAERLALLERRAAISDALNEAIELFTSHSEHMFEDVMSGGLEVIARAAGFDRAAIYQQLDGKDQIGQTYLWHGRTLPLEKEVTALPNIPPVLRWVEILKTGRCINADVSQIPKDEAEFLTLFGVKAIFFVPIFTHGVFWGVVTMEDHTRYRAFDEDSLDILSAAARLCANVFIRMNTTQNAADAYVKVLRRDLLMETLNKTAIRFLSQSEDDFDSLLNDSIMPIADEADLDSIVFYTYVDVDREKRLGQIYRWSKTEKGSLPLTDSLRILPNLPVVTAWTEILSGGRSISRCLDNMTEEEKAFLGTFGVKSIILVPVFMRGDFWGAVAFQDHIRARTFDDDNAALFHSTAHLCANAIIRQEMKRDADDAFRRLEYRERLTETLNKAAIKFLSQSKDSFEDMMTAGVGMFADTLGIDRLSVWRNSKMPDGLHGSQIYRWDKESGGTTTPTQSLGDLAYASLAPRWETLLSDNQLINSPVSLLPEQEAKLLQSFGVVSAFIAPIMNDNAFWGFVLVEDRRTERYFDDDCTQILSSAAYLFANTVIKDEMEHKIFIANNLLAARLEQQEIMTDISNGFISSGGAETLVNEALAKLGRHYGVSFVLVFSVDYGRRDAALAYSWISGGERLRMVELDLFGLITGYFPDELPEGGDVPKIVCGDTAASPVEAFRRLTEADVGAFICVPIYAEGRLWGFMCVEQCHAPRDWTESEETLIGMTASTISGAVMRDIYDKERTAALERATAASRAKGDFLSNMSHEMRTPLNAIIGMTAIGKNTADIERKDYTLSKIEDASANLLAVINDVLDMSKIEANKLELSPVEFNLERMLQKVLTIVKFRMDEKRQRFDVNVDAKVPHFIIGDDQRLSQVITNLLSNACKFTPEGGEIRLGVSLEEEEGGLCALRFEVADSGIGVSPEQKKRLFQAFSQAESGTSRKFGGTGLGLALCKRIVELMAGEIWVESELGKGARFLFTIKAARGKQDLLSLLNPGVKREDLRILAVDDEEVIRIFLQGLFDHIGIPCCLAADGFEALRMVEDRGGYDLYLIDRHMPGMDGVELTKRIKARDETSVVVMFSSDWMAVRDEALTAGVDRYMMKPLFSSAIVECINECLDAGCARQGEAFIEKTQGRFAGKTLLIAEDVDINREILISLLGETGLVIDEAKDGQEALGMVEADPGRYDLVFMDMQMPVMDGMEATRRIRALPAPRAGKLPIIAMTANVFKEDIELCYQAGMNGHLGKPLDIDELFAVLREYLRRGD